MAERRTTRTRGRSGRSAEAEKDTAGGDLVDDMVDTEAAPAGAADDTEEPARDEDTPRRRAAGGTGLSAAEAGRLGMQQIAELTGKAPEGVTGVERAEDGWLVSVEVVEDRRVPSSTDILATYEAEIDSDGNLVSYRRVHRYSRGHGDSGGAS